MAGLDFLKGGLDRSFHEEGKVMLKLPCRPQNAGNAWTTRHLLRKAAGGREELSKRKSTCVATGRSRGVGPSRAVEPR